MAELRDYQLTAAHFLATAGRALLADAPRVGKTAAAIRACEMVGSNKVLWVTTGSARADHHRAWHRFETKPHVIRALYAGPPVHLDSTDVLILSYDQVTRHREALAKHQWDTIVLDEMHKLKGRESKRTEVIYGRDCKGDTDSLVGRAEHVFALSGTPAPNNYAELWPFLRAVLPEAIQQNVMLRDGLDTRPMSYWTFAERFCRLKDDGFGVKIVGNKNADDLRTRMSPFVLRRTLDDIAPQVPRIQTDVLHLGDKKAVRELKQIEMDDRLLRLKGALEVAKDDETRALIIHSATAHIDKTFPRLTGLAKVDPIVEWLLEEAPEKIVIFHWHTEVAIRIYSGLGGSANAVVVNGATTGVQRGQHVERFQTDPKCRFFIGQIQAAGEGIDLSAADEVLFAESSWVPGHNEQAALRVVNVNKHRPTLARLATIPGSLDERIQRVASNKLRDLNKLYGKDM